PFLYTLISAIVFTVVFQPVHQRVLCNTRQRRGIAALVTAIIIITIVLVPVLLLGIQIFQEAQQLYSSVTEGGGKDNILNAVKEITIHIQRYIPVPMEFSLNFDKYLEQGLGWLLKNIGGVFSNIAKMILNFFIFLIALYYLLKDGQRLKKAVVALSPLTDIDDEKIFNRLELAVNSVIKGNLTVALIQGGLTAIGFAIFGVPNAVLWGTVTAIAALIPGFGTSLVLIPAILFLFLNNEIYHAIGLLVWGAVAVGLVDNLLGPKLIGRGIQMHPFIILLSVLGGIGFFGPIGFLLGPLAISLLFAFLEIYSSLKTQESPESDHSQTI
ncbi:MAG: AI-2E family transporter, partial [Proteobacteria bacterium]|nr:AI-2E family transporter [Pseudomonadota bacterium]